MDEAGNVAITDRLKDMYVSGGFNVYPAEIEAVLRQHPAVGQVAVIGVPDDRMGEVGLAVVVPAAGGRPAIVEDELIAWARERLANYKVPRAVETGRRPAGQRQRQGAEARAAAAALRRPVGQPALTAGPSDHPVGMPDAPTIAHIETSSNRAREGGMPCEASSTPVTTPRSPTS